MALPIGNALYQRCRCLSVSESQQAHADVYERTVWTEENHLRIFWFWREGGSKGKGWLRLLFIAIQKVCESLAEHSRQSYFCINKDVVEEAFRLNSALLLRVPVSTYWTNWMEHAHVFTGCSTHTAVNTSPLRFFHNVSSCCSIHKFLKELWLVGVVTFWKAHPSKAGKLSAQNRDRRRFSLQLHSKHRDWLCDESHLEQCDA